ncbi:MAG: ABC transporter substrate-binding protein [Deltaproteobacteria bacterium]|nr:ABC transporter substrate-binding protein [Deltaproteobacteria bacterium]
MRTLIRSLFGVFLLVSFPALLHGQSLSKVTVGYSSVSTSFLPLWAASETGIFKKNGLDVQVVFFNTGTTAVQALLSGDSPISHTAGSGIVNSRLGGSDAVLIVGGTVSLDWWLLSRPEIKTPEQLKGGFVAISSFGSSSDFVARFALRRIGLEPDKNLTIVQVGSPLNRQAALETNRVQATVHVHPSTFIAQKKGFNVLADVAALGLAYQHTGVATTRRFIEQHPDIVRRYVKSQLECVHRLKIDRETGIRVLAKHMGGIKDREILEKSYDLAVADNMLPRNQYPTLEGIKTILDTLADKAPRAKGAKPEDFVDMRFVRELEQSGFINNLYGGK